MNNPTPNNQTVFAKLNDATNNAKRMAPINKGSLVSNFSTNHPESGKPKIELIGMTKSNEPNSASFSPNISLIVGTLDANVANVSPDKKKTMLKAILFLTFVSTKEFCRKYREV